MTEEMVGYCGYGCPLCAPRSDDTAGRHRLMDGWRRILGYEHYTTEKVHCDGRLSDGSLAEQPCKTLPCAIERGVKNCAYCEDFVCEKVGHRLGSQEGLVIFCRPEDGPVTKEEYELCRRQFDSLPIIVRMLADAVLAGLTLLSIAFHVNCREQANVIVSIVLFAIAAFVAYGRWVLLPL